MYYSSAAGLNNKITENMPPGIKMVAKHPRIAPTLRQAAEVDWYCPASRNVFPNGRDVVPPDGDSRQPPPPEECGRAQNPDRTLGVTVTFPECLDRSTRNDPKPQVIQALGRAYPIPAPGTRSCPDGHTQIPTLQLFVNYEIPDGVTYTDPSSLEVAGMDGSRVPWSNMHADYFNAEDLESLVKLCINSPRLGEGNPNDRCEHQPR